MGFNLEYFFSILFGTFLLEDVTLAAALALVANDKVSFEIAFLACFIGICLGDIGLYYIGFFSEKIKFIQNLKFIKNLKIIVKEKNPNFLGYSIVACRFVPGTRIPTYFISGLTRYPIAKFIFLTVITVLAWVALAFAVGKSLEPLLSDHLILTVISFLIFLKVVKFVAPLILDSWSRKSFVHSWRKYLYFEFWPATLFYIPIYFYYAFLSLRYRSFIAPFYANPAIENSGLIGESKDDFLKHLDPESSHALNYLKFNNQNGLEASKNLLKEKGFNYPFILKPDVGQRGFGVRIIRNDVMLADYLVQADFDIIAQELSSYIQEAGIFYIRKPSEEVGFLFSITDKKFPSIIGDGRNKFGDLILKDKRARIIADTYFSRHKDALETVLSLGEAVQLTECGNHCQGAIFINANDFITPELTLAVDKVAKQIPNFHFGRLDIRYKTVDALKHGQDFDIIEINGAGAEATHIWDARTKLIDAYKTLFLQWNYLFAIGDEVKRSKIESRVRVNAFLKESYRVFFRKSTLARSS